MGGVDPPLQSLVWPPIRAWLDSAAMAEVEEFAFPPNKREGRIDK